MASTGNKKFPREFYSSQSVPPQTATYLQEHISRIFDEVCSPSNSRIFDHSHHRKILKELPLRSLLQAHTHPTKRTVEKIME
uniref:Uncharacterized protein n=1 Tax=Arundo donax TaxID=35708 RepID=A0A0A9BQB7_ARUDO